MKKFNQNSGVMVEMDPFTKEEFQRVEEILEYSRTAAANGELSEYVNKLGIYYQAKDSVSLGSSFLSLKIYSGEVG